LTDLLAETKDKNKRK
jgi:chromosome segregation ATPase